MMKNQKILKKPLFFLMLLAIVIGIGTTFAYYYSVIVIPNQFKAMTYNVTVEEEFNNDWGTKKVSFINKEETNTPVVLRITYNEVWEKVLEDGTILTLNNLVNGKEVAIKNWTSSFQNFTLKEDGWYYYNKILNSKESVQVLESVTKNPEIDTTPNHYGANYELSFNFEAIQASTNAIQEIWGVDPTITGGDVVW